MTKIDKLVTVILPMSKDTQIHLRVSQEAKAAIERAADRDARTVSNWLLWLAAKADPEVARTLKK